MKLMSTVRQLTASETRTSLKIVDKMGWGCYGCMDLLPVVYCLFLIWGCNTNYDGWRTVMMSPEHSSVLT